MFCFSHAFKEKCIDHIHVTPDPDCAAQAKPQRLVAMSCALSQNIKTEKQKPHQKLHSTTETLRGSCCFCHLFCRRIIGASYDDFHFAEREMEILQHTLPWYIRVFSPVAVFLPAWGARAGNRPQRTERALLPMGIVVFMPFIFPCEICLLVLLVH